MNKDTIELESKETAAERENRTAMHRYMNGFVEWAKELPLADMKQVTQWMRDIRAAHTPSKRA